MPTKIDSLPTGAPLPDSGNGPECSKHGNAKVRRNGMRGWHCMDCVRGWARTASRNLSFKRRGITEEQYAALEKQQGRVCAICQRPQIGKALAVDHCHTTGAVRGLLCHHCNVALGQFQDDPERLRRAAAYLEEFI